MDRPMYRAERAEHGQALADLRNRLQREGYEVLKQFSSREAQDTFVGIIAKRVDNWYVQSVSGVSWDQLQGRFDELAAAGHEVEDVLPDRRGRYLFYTITYRVYRRLSS